MGEEYLVEVEKSSGGEANNRSKHISSIDFVGASSKGEGFTLINGLLDRLSKQ